MSQALLKATSLERTFESPRSGFGRAEPLRAVDGVSLEVAPGETLGLVGESGCGKSTLGRLLLRLMEPTGGAIEFDGIDLTKLPKGELRRLRARMQMVFQDPYSSLDPRYTIGASLEEPFVIQGKRRDHAFDSVTAATLLETVGLSPKLAEAYPHQLSGGQLQRVAIARAVALSPQLVVFDEPTAWLDVSVQGQIVRLLEELRSRQSLTYIFISHNMALVRYLADRIAVMYLGRIVEVLPSARTRPLHYYSRVLMDSVFDSDPTKRRQIAPAAVGTEHRPSAAGCSFAERCPAVTALCRSQRPAMTEIAPRHFIACHHIENESHGNSPHATDD